VGYNFPHFWSLWGTEGYNAVPDWVKHFNEIIYESLFVKKLTDNHTHRRTHTRDKHNKNS